VTHRPDPLDLLRKVAVPEPDAARRQATLSMARARFAHGKRIPLPLSARKRWPAWAAGWRFWMFPAGSLAALALAVFVLEPVRQPKTSSEFARDEPSAGPNAAARSGGPDAASGRTFGARPPSGLSDHVGASAGSETRRTFEDFEIVIRATPDQLSLSLARDGRETAFDRLFRDPGMDFEIRDAFIQPRAGDLPLLLVQSHWGSISWSAYVIDGEEIRRAGALTSRIFDAPDRAAVTQRLSLQD
jgi:hypothetical protein